MAVAADCGKDGLRAKEQVLTFLERRRRDFVRSAQRKLIGLLRERPTATIDDLRERLTIPPDVSPTTLGAIPKALIAGGVIRRAGYTESTRAVAHGRPVSTWTLVSTQAADLWLTNHPEPAPMNSPTVQGQLFTDAGDAQ